MSKSKIKICAILWQDAACYYCKEIPKTTPPKQLTTGFIIETNDEFANIATNVNYNPKTKKLSPIDGFIIPKGAVSKVKVIDFLDDSKKR